MSSINFHAEVWVAATAATGAYVSVLLQEIAYAQRCCCGLQQEIAYGALLLQLLQPPLQRCLQSEELAYVALGVAAVLQRAGQGGRVRKNKENLIACNDVVNILVAVHVLVSQVSKDLASSRPYPFASVFVLLY